MFILIIKRISLFGEKRDKVMLYAMVFSVYLLFAFSESGIGPNTCSYFMIMIGLCIGKETHVLEKKEEM